jgi:WD40 repeat protein
MTTLLTNSLFEARKYEGHKDKVTCLALSTDGKSFVTGSVDRSVRLWNRDTGKSKVIDQPAEVTAVAMSSDGTTVACGFSTGVVRLLDVSGAEPKELHSFTQQTTPITAVTFSPQGKYLFAGSKDGTVLSLVEPWCRPASCRALAEGTGRARNGLLREEGHSRPRHQ